MDAPPRDDAPLSREHRQWLLTVLLPGAILAAGFLLRLAEYLHNKAIWLDEAYVALNVLDRGYAALLEPLEFGQAAPIGFLYGERFMAEHLGPSEYALRAIPLLGSLVALGLFGWLLRRWVSVEAGLVALAAFALSMPPIRYAAEVKPYATDVAATLVLVGLATRYLQRPRPIHLVLLAVAGAAAVWCSYPATFVLAGAGFTLAVAAVGKRAWGRLAAIATAGAVWVASFALYYRLSLQVLGANKEVLGWWADAYMPFPPSSPAHIHWFVRTFLDLFTDPAGIPLAGIAALAFVLGVLSMLFRDRLTLLLLLTPIAAALFASGLQRYPFTGRFLLFAVPLMLPLVGEGAEVIRKRSRTPLIYVTVLVLMFLQPAIAGVRTLVKPSTLQGVRPAYTYLKDHYRKGDTIYLYHWAQFPFRYCMQRDGVSFPFRAGVTSRADWTYYVEDMNKLLGNRRVWLVFVNTPKELTGEEEKFFLTWLDTQGVRTDEFRARESSVYRYDLTGARVPVDKDD